MTNKQLLTHIIKAIDEVNSNDIKIYETSTITPFFDYAVVATAKSSRQILAAVEHLQKESDEAKFKIRGIEGARGGYWALIDVNDIIVNIFISSERDKYDLDKKWINLPQIDVEELRKK